MTVLPLTVLVVVIVEVIEPPPMDEKLWRGEGEGRKGGGREGRGGEECVYTSEIIHGCGDND